MNKLRYLVRRMFAMFPLPAIKNSAVDKKAWVASRCQIVDSSIGKYSYLGQNCIVINSAIGKFCSIGANCNIGGAEHPLSFVSTSPIFYGGYRKTFSLKKYKLGNLEWNSNSKNIVIGNDVWIGNNAIIKSGVSIADGAVIGAGSVVTKNVGPYEVWAGNPSKLIKKRFSDEQINELLKIRWWNKTDEQLISLSDNFNNIDVFLSKGDKQ